MSLLSFRWWIPNCLIGLAPNALAKNSCLDRPAPKSSLGSAILATKTPSVINNHTITMSNRNLIPGSQS